MPHRPILLVTGVFVILIGAVLMVAPDVYLRLYVTNYVPGMEFGARRFAPAVLGLGVLLILARDLSAGRFLTMLCALTGAVFWGVAATGAHAFATGIAQPSILLAAAIEIAIGTVFFLSARRLAGSR